MSPALYDLAFAVLGGVLGAMTRELWRLVKRKPRHKCAWCDVLVSNREHALCESCARIGPEEWQGWQ